MFIDSHAHLGYDAIYQNIDLVLKRAFDSGVTKIINICTDRQTADRGCDLRKRYPNIFNVGSTTPHDTASLGESDFEVFERLARKQELVAIGETGLDYFYDYSPKKIQIEYFRRYLELAINTKLPIVIHCRDAFDDLFSITDEIYRGFPLLLHCFTGGKQEAKKALDRGWKISFSGIVTFKKSLELQEVAQYVPLNSMMIETDSPYLAPQSKRGQTNEPSFLVETAKFIADLKKTSLSELSSQTALTTESFFNI